MAACQGLDSVDPERILQDTVKNLFDGVLEAEVRKTLILATRTKIEQEPNYSLVAARLLLTHCQQEAFSLLSIPHPESLDLNRERYQAAFLKAQRGHHHSELPNVPNDEDRCPQDHSILF